MKTKEFYTVLIPLINVILTGNRNIDSNSDYIALSPAFIKCYSQLPSTTVNAYFLECMDLYFENLHDKDRQKLTKLFLENRSLLSIAVLIRDADCAVKQSQAFYNDELILILLDFLDRKKPDITLHLTLYLYLENLLEIEIYNETIPLEIYTNILSFNSSVRSI